MAELATLLSYKLGHADALRALTAIRASESINAVSIGTAVFEATLDRFERYDGQEISFIDHTTGILADERGVEYVFAFDSDFRTLGLSLVPDDVHCRQRSDRFSRC